jgi:CubicO group peptidase (beta-lactamase class C family)
MNVYRWALGVALAALPAAADAQAVPTDSIDRFVRAEMERQHVPGLAVAVIRGGTVLYAQGYGVADRERQIPVTPQTVFKIGSVSKQFLASGIMILVQEGRLQLDDPVSKFLDGTPDTWSAITLRHLLTHTSGIRREGPRFNPLIRQPDMDVVRSAYGVPLEFETGTKYQYCNVCYFALAEIIARVSGKPWDVWFREHVFAPLGMSATATTGDSIPNRARGYDWQNDAYRPAFNYVAVRPSGAFVSSVLDLAKWDAALYSGAPLTIASRDQMWTPARLNDGKPVEYGLGWALDEEPCSELPRRRAGFSECGPNEQAGLVSHGGSLPGFRAAWDHMRRDSLTVIVLTNGDDANTDAFMIGVTKLVFGTSVPLRERPEP